MRAFWKRPPLWFLLLLLAVPVLHLTAVQARSIQKAATQRVASAADSLGGVRTVPKWAFWLQQTWAGAELLALLFAAYQLWARREERRRAEAEAAVVALKAANYQAWSVVNSAQGKGGSGGRIDALQDLNRNGISLAGVRLDGAWLEGIALPAARLRQASLCEANLIGADLQGADLTGAELKDVNLTGAKLQGAFFKCANLAGAHLGTADLRGADLTELRGWREIRGATYLQIEGVRHPPIGFREWALAHGAVDAASESTDMPQEGFSTHFRAV
jgi:Pentapeptide repeats (8 copies)